VTPAELLQAIPGAGSRADAFAAPLAAAMIEFGIDTPSRKAAFLAQIAHESGSLKYVREIADGTAYEGRMELGNTEPGDGPRYRGRGLLQITGKANYASCGAALGLPLLAHPELLESPENASRSAGWFWKLKGLNQYADRNMFATITKLINGGYNGLDDRLTCWLTARKALGIV
jgi:putative chitinase